MTHSLYVDPEGIGAAFCNRVMRANMHILRDEPIPWFPDGFDPPVRCDRGFVPSRHICEEEPEIYLPGVLVFDVDFYDAFRCKRTRNRLRFPPYWIGPVRLVHEGGTKEPNEREATPQEGVCSLCWISRSRERARWQGLASVYRPGVLRKCAGRHAL